MSWRRWEGAGGTTSNSCYTKSCLVFPGTTSWNPGLGSMAPGPRWVLGCRLPEPNPSVISTAAPCPECLSHNPARLTP